MPTEIKLLDTELLSAEMSYLSVIKSLQAKDVHSMESDDCVARPTDETEQ